MRLLLDTHVVLWWWIGAPQLSRASRQIITGAEHVWVSAVCAWELAVKSSQGRLRLPAPLATMLPGPDFEELPVTIRHAERLLALVRHHGDPFDRMLVAQALIEGATLVTHDRQFRPYDVPVVWV